MPIDEQKLTSLGLIPQDILSHQRKIKRSLANQHKEYIPVIDTCRIENGGIIDPKELANLVKEPSGFVAFVPAAGAASRYFKELRPLEAALESENIDEITSEIDRLLALGAKEWALPESVHHALEQGPDFAFANRQIMIQDINLPKALQPCMATGESFLDLKLAEHQKLKGLEAQVFVTPPGQQQDFQDRVSVDQPPFHFTEQGPELSTIRFKPDGEPLELEDGSYSPVPAGHGTLVKLFPEIKEKFPQGHSIFIRNIDNITGTSATCIDQTAHFLRTHQTVLERIQTIRQAIDVKDRDSYKQAAISLMADMKVRISEDQESFTQTLAPHLQDLFRLQMGLFHFNHQCPEIFGIDDHWELIQYLYQRPVNCLGQVPNLGHDVGGTPLFAEIEGGTATICLEVPHASPDDKANFLGNPKKATHFNPVFVAAELVDDPSIYLSDTTPFWVMAKKNFMMESVVYHETVLYELLGNSIMANAIFPAIPRDLFNPHKTAADTCNHSIDEWLV
ncbi:DUF4301 family protein [Pseudobacteriovorax antillogorgiicola]|uniref:DUF4301 domain-containing protein n=1 Tax=Pseudobacteriovorax antillogorgiicola TaxID=1513793 RepID=A0A1Y6BKM8_9BACT|nr:DUF4301 family protein [Pseudobacteriovorax antillogorgiicola]TCS55324.1 uncharacterized protein DUF4301 [Pseudobacteriovorax antillogorgiicola]SMF14161.1 protein of unknown function [Pseudobacteriovorax antillogorgiicola]